MRDTSRTDIVRMLTIINKEEDTLRIRGILNKVSATKKIPKDKDTINTVGLENTRMIISGTITRDVKNMNVMVVINSQMIERIARNISKAINQGQVIPMISLVHKAIGLKKDDLLNQISN